MLIEPADRADHAQRELRRTHLHREHRDRQSCSQCDVLANVQGESGLAHRRTSGDHHEVAWLQARRLLVEIGKSRRHTGNRRWIVAVVEQLDTLDDVD